MTTAESESKAEGRAARQSRAESESKAEGRAARQSRAESDVWTVLDLLQWTRDHFSSCGIETPRLDAECLLAFALGVDRLRLYMDFDKPVSRAERSGYRDLVRRRADERVPVAQLVGRKEFWSLPLRVTADVLRERPKARVTATDVSAPSLEVARSNAAELGLADRMRFLQGPDFEPVAGERFDLVVSNPPYVAETLRDRLPPELAHEPPGALFAGPDGLAVLRVLAAGVGGVLESGAGAAFEVSPEQAPQVATWCREAGLLDVTVARDLGSRPRVVWARKPGEGAP
jgi:release factor glutamine methyltransferase